MSVSIDVKTNLNLTVVLEGKSGIIKTVELILWRPGISVLIFMLIAQLFNYTLGEMLIQCWFNYLKGSVFTN